MVDRVVPPLCGKDWRCGETSYTTTTLDDIALNSAGNWLELGLALGITRLPHDRTVAGTERDPTRDDRGQQSD